MIEWIQGNKCRIVMPEGTMHKFFRDNKPYELDLMHNSFFVFLHYIQFGRLGLFGNLSLNDWEAVRRIAIGKRDIPVKVNLE